MTAKDLKNALLQEAVQGKLVPQIASEGNARDLLKEIRKERGESLPLAPARKRSSATPSAGSNAARNARFAPITEEDIPFDIPENWCWCRLGEIVPFGTCKNAEPNEIEEEDWILDLEDIEKDSGKILAFKTKKQVDVKSTKHVFIKGNVLYSKLRPYLNKCVIAPKNGFCTSEILPLDFGEHIYNKYAQLYLMSPFFVDYTNSLSFGVKMPRLGTEDGKKALFPLPPFAEQKRIVAAIEKFMPLIEEYGKKENELKAFNEQIGTLTKKAILQEAVQGKLVPQIAAEGNAKDLLEEIKKEKNILIKEGKIKKEKTLPEITEDEIPFDIPESWCWCRLGEIVDTNIGLTYSPSDIITEGGTEVLRSNNIQNGKIVYDDLVHVSKSVPEKCLSKKGDLLICARNGSKALVGKSALIEKDGMAFGAFMAIVRSPINPYILHFINSPVYRAKLEGVNTTTINQITQDNLRETLFPLPPLEEQKRIVAAIEKLLPLCEKLGE